MYNVHPCLSKLYSCTGDACLKYLVQIAFTILNFKFCPHLCEDVATIVKKAWCIVVEAWSAELNFLGKWTVPLLKVEFHMYRIEFGNEMHVKFDV